MIKAYSQKELGHRFEISRSQPYIETRIVSNIAGKETEFISFMT